MPHKLLDRLFAVRDLPGAVFFGDFAPHSGHHIGKAPRRQLTGPDGNCNSTPGNIFFYQLCRLLSHLGTSCPKVGLSFRMAQRGPFPFPLQRGTVYNFLES